MATTPILIGCHGGDPDAHEVLSKGGWKYGSRSDGTIYAKPYFVDINWKRYFWLKHWLVLKRWKPDMAMAADYLCPSQKENMLRQVSHITRLGITPMVCPKFPGASRDIPDDAIVAVSVPTKYAGFLPDKSELKNRRLHLLGGHPDQMVLVTRYYSESLIISVDCSVFFLKAAFGAYWCLDKGDWQYAPKNTMKEHDLLIKSANNIAEYVANPPKVVSNSRRAATIYRYTLAKSIFET